MTDEPNQPLQTSLLDGFGNLKEIDDARDVHVRKQTTLEHLIVIGEELKTRFQSLVNNSSNFSLIYDNVYTPAYDTALGLLANVSFQEDDIKEYVFSNLNRDDAISEKMILGMYTGFLLDILTRRNKSKDNAKGKRTRIYINGHGSRFDYLFFFAKTIDELIVDNFRGDSICSFIGSYYGRTNSIALLNIIGDGTASNIASNHGKVEQVISINNNGKGLIGCGGGFYGGIGQVVVIDNMGTHEPGRQFGEINTGARTVIIDYKYKYKLDSESRRKPYHYNPSDLQIMEKMLSLATQMMNKPEKEILMHLDELRKILPNAPKGNYEIH